MSERYAQLLTPFELKGKRFANRFVMAPMTRGHSPGGVPGPDVAAYYGRRASEVGLIVTEGVGIAHPSAIGDGSVDEGEIPEMIAGEPLEGWRRVVDSVHAGCALIMPQLWHMGPIRRPRSGRHPQARSMRPSGIWGPLDRSAMSRAYLPLVAEPIEPMTESEIADVVAAYATSARLAMQAGFDGVAIHGAHGYLFDSFLWSGTNHRTDRWGGDLARRLAFPVAVIEAIRAAVGPDMIIALRFSQWKQQDFAARLAHNPDELLALLGPLADAGVDLFDVSARRFDDPAFETSPLSLAAWTRKLTGKAVCAVGSVGIDKDLYTSFAEATVTCNNLGRVAEAFDRGDFDLIALGRALLMDSRFISKALAGAPLPPFRREAYATLD